jgi:probable HAF family extracellular repeat protein
VVTGPNQRTGPTISAFTHGYPVTVYGINNTGQIVGSSGIDVGSRVEYHAFRRTSGGKLSRAEDLGTIASPGRGSSVAYGINERGQIVGGSQDGPDGNMRSFRTAPDARINPLTHNLGTFGGASTARLTCPAKSSATPHWPTGATSGTLSARSRTGGSVGPATWAPSAEHPAAWDINDAGVVVGGADAPGGELHAFAYFEKIVSAVC